MHSLHKKTELACYQFGWSATLTILVGYEQLIKLNPLTFWYLRLIACSFNAISLYQKQLKDLDKEKLVHELGDVLWYLSQIAEWADIPFNEVAQENIETLNKRYPNGFNPAN